jgi:AcrR family transcriptional regulator
VLRSRIVEAAAKMFSQQGYHATSTRAIAMLAHVNENTLFRHFICKEDLFWLSLRSRLADFKATKEFQLALDESSGPEILVPQILELLVNAVESHPEMIRLISIAWLELNDKADRIFQEFLTPIVSLILHSLTSCVRSKKLREVDPMILTAAIGASVLAHTGVFRVLNGSTPRFADSKQAIAAYSDFWLAILTRNIDEPAWDSGPVQLSSRARGES